MYIVCDFEIVHIFIKSLLQIKNVFKIVLAIMMFMLQLFNLPSFFGVCSKIVFYNFILIVK